MNDVLWVELWFLLGECKWILFLKKFLYCLILVSYFEIILLVVYFVMVSFWDCDCNRWVIVCWSFLLFCLKINCFSVFWILFLVCWINFWVIFWLLVFVEICSVIVVLLVVIFMSGFLFCWIIFVKCCFILFFLILKYFRFWCRIYCCE